MNDVIEKDNKLFENHLHDKIPENISINDDVLVNLLAEILIDIIIKKQQHGRNRICKDQ